MHSHIRRIVGMLPSRLRHRLRRANILRRLHRGKFASSEAEYHILEKFVRPNDWVLDIGANFGVYTARLSGLVGPAGRVIAIEPAHQSFDILNAVVQELPLRNVTLLNVACFSDCRVLPLRIPADDTHIENLYEATLDAESAGTLVLCIPVDAMRLPQRVSLVKIDVEGAELMALKGMEGLLERDRPTLVVEWNPGMEEIVSYLAGFDYQAIVKSKIGRNAEGLEQQNYVFQVPRPAAAAP